MLNVTGYLDLLFVIEKIDSSFKICVAQLLKKRKIINVTLARSLSAQVCSAPWFKAIG